METDFTDYLDGVSVSTHTHTHSHQGEAGEAKPRGTEVPGIVQGRVTVDTVGAE